MPGLITEIEDFVDVEAGQGWLRYQIDGKQRQWDIEVEADWADPTVIECVMAKTPTLARRPLCLESQLAQRAKLRHTNP